MKFPSPDDLWRDYGMTYDDFRSYEAELLRHAVLHMSKTAKQKLDRYLVYQVKHAVNKHWKTHAEQRLMVWRCFTA